MQWDEPLLEAPPSRAPAALGLSRQRLAAGSLARRLETASEQALKDIYLFAACAGLLVVITDCLSVDQAPRPGRDVGRSLATQLGSRGRRWTCESVARLRPTTRPGRGAWSTESQPAMTTNSPACARLVANEFFRWVACCACRAAQRARQHDHLARGLKRPAMLTGDV